ncbi:MAG: hypothetical protein WAV05_06275, partial [Anaerolineales bacterium]
MKTEKRTITTGGTVTTNSDDEYTYFGGTARNEEYKKLVLKMIEENFEYTGKTTYQPENEVGDTGIAQSFEDKIIADYKYLWSHPGSREKGVTILEKVAINNNYNPTGCYK